MPENKGIEPEGHEPEIPETVAVPGRKRQGKPRPFKAADLRERVLNLWMDVPQLAREFLKSGTPKIFGRWKMSMDISPK